LFLKLEITKEFFLKLVEIRFADVDLGMFSSQVGREMQELQLGSFRGPAVQGV